MFDNSTGGNYGLVIGYIESFTLVEWVLLPFDLISIYQWEGQHILFIFAPIISIIITGIAIFSWRQSDKKSPRIPSQWVGCVAGLLILSTGASVIFQMIYALTKTSIVVDIIITIMLRTIPILIGIGILRTSLGDGINNNVQRLKLSILGILAIFAWAGFIIGPVLAITASFVSAFEEKRSDVKESE